MYDPARGEQIAEVSLASSGEVEDVIKSAADASVAWAESSLTARANLLFRLRDLIDRHRDDLARRVTREHGKVVSDALGEVARGLECVEFACGIPNLLKGSYSAQVSTGVDVHTVLEPLGVALGITPFNFPVMVPLWMLSNALACGNAFMLKPSERDPSPSLLLAELIQQAGFPDGVFNVVQGDAEAVNTLLDPPGRRCRVLRGKHAGGPPRVRHGYPQREAGAGPRGGQEPYGRPARRRRRIAADAAVSAAYGSAGERCMAISVVVAVGSVADDLVGAVKDRIPDVVIGPGDARTR